VGYAARPAVQSKAKGRRVPVSADDSEGRNFGNLFVFDGGKRHVSTGMVDMLELMSLSEEPEDMTQIEEDDGNH
jgi:hypothetical protein